MSKQSKAKEDQGYVDRAEPQVCCKCAHYTSDLERKSAWGNNWIEEKNKRCGIGNFAVKKMGTCNLFVLKASA